jgi:hypothetical protein
VQMVLEGFSHSLDRPAPLRLVIPLGEKLLRRLNVRLPPKTRGTAAGSSTHAPSVTGRMQASQTPCRGCFRNSFDEGIAFRACFRCRGR